jgi:predicted small lipoprotein YifL
MQVVFRMSAIVAALAVATSAVLTGCGLRGPLYLPTVPPLPEKPARHTEPSAPDASRDTSAQAQAQMHAPLTLAPADSLSTGSSVKRATPDAGAASSPALNQ